MFFCLPEFIAATIEDNIELKEEKLLQAFKMFDLDGSGKISAEELKQILGSKDRYFFFVYLIEKDNETVKNTDQKYWEEMIKEVDKNGDGEVLFFFKKKILIYFILEINDLIIFKIYKYPL